jgi:predicted DsbA family dithiol-disulfide isomerase
MSEPGGMTSPPAVVDVSMKVEIWSDVVCPWCYVGKRRFEAALQRFEQRDEVDVTWRAFELDPAAPRRRQRDYPGHLSAKYGVSPTEAQAMIDRMTETTASAGMDFRFDVAKPGNTFDAHRLTHLAADRGLGDAVVERLLSATFTEGRAIGDRDVLVQLAAQAGLDPDEGAETLSSDAYAAAVRADEQEAAALGIHAVPFFVVDRTYGVSGAQSPEVLLSVLERAWADGYRPLLVTGAGDAPGCEDDSCAV